MEACTLNCVGSVLLQKMINVVPVILSYKLKNPIN